MKERIGIVANERFFSTEKVDFWMSYTSKGYVEGVQQAGGLPLILPIGQASEAKEYIDTIDRLILAGGQDIEPRFYHQEATDFLGETNEARDLFELALIHEAIKQKKPILGICRGMQLINIACGGTLYQDLSFMQTPLLTHVQIQPMDQISHSILVEKNSWLGSFLPEKYEVNSAHHQGIHQLAPNFKVTARASDGIIEGIESIDSAQKIFGIQWHPELTHDKIACEQAIFQHFIQGK